MTLSIPDALRMVAWLLVPEHFLALYVEQVVEAALALFGASVLALWAVRRYRCALAALALSAALLAAPPAARGLVPAARRYAAHRIVHRVHAPRRPHASVAASGPAAHADAAPEIPAVPVTGAAPAPPAGKAAVPAERIPQRPVPRQAAPLSEPQLLAVANNEVIGPLIGACRQAAGGAR